MRSITACPMRAGWRWRRSCRSSRQRAGPQGRCGSTRPVTTQDQTFALTWIEDGKLTNSARALIDRIGRADEDGLDAAAYAVAVAKYWRLHRPPTPPDLPKPTSCSARQSSTTPADAYSGRLEPIRKSARISATRPRRWRRRISSVSSRPRRIRSRPLRPTIRRRRNTAAARRTREGAQPGPGRTQAAEVAEGGLIKPGMSDPRVVEIRARLEITTEVADPTGLR